jgi:serine/threonine-protein kinase
MSADDPRPRLADTWELVRKIGEGGMGAVWEGRHRRMGRRVAIKLMRPGLGEGSVVASRLLREAQAAAAVGSDHVVDVLDAGEAEDGAPYLVMEYLEGETLAAALAREAGHALTVERAVGVMIQVCRALGAAHERGVVHRDLKPANLFLTRRSDGAEWVKVLDFGIAKVRESREDPRGRLTVEGELLGTPAYMAPESVGGSAEVDHRADVYSAGAVLYELLTGRPPFEASSYRRMIVLISTEDPPKISALRPDAPAGLEPVVARALARDPDARYQSMAELARALAPFAERDRPTAPAEGPVRSELEIAPTLVGSPEAAGPPPRTMVQPERPVAATQPRSIAALLAVRARDLYARHRAATLGAGAAAVVLVFVAAIAAEVAGRAAGSPPQPGCPPEKVQNEETGGHCCWPGQTWSDERSTCAGEVRCPPGRRPRGERCDCMAGMVEIGEPGGHCCFPGQRWSAAEGGGRCSGSPRCPASWRRARDLCLPDLRAPGDWVAISAGTFTMGSDEAEPGRAPDEAEHLVDLSRDYALSATEVTQAQFEEVMGYNPSFAERCGERCPVEGLSWHEAAAYTVALSRAESLEPCYECAGSGRGVRCAPRRGRGDPSGCAGYRLPTEAEWEYAARAWTETATYGGDLAPGLLECESPNVVLLKIAWFCANSSGSAHTVAGLEPNRFGLFDMLGNVWEWCHDPYRAAHATRPDEVSGDGGRRVIRGGSWSGHGARARSASRFGEDPTVWRSHIGFRVARSLPATQPRDAD